MYDIWPHSDDVIDIWYFLTLLSSYILECCIKIKINLKFYFHFSLWCLRRFYWDLEGLHKTFWGTAKKCENKYLSSFVFFVPGSLREWLTFRWLICSPVNINNYYLLVDGVMTNKEIIIVKFNFSGLRI